MTNHRKPVAKIVPVGANNTVAWNAWNAMLSRLRSQPVTEIGRWTRDELYEDATSQTRLEHD